MGKVRVFELASRHKLPIPEMMDAFRKNGVSVRNHMSAVQEDVARKVLLSMGIEVTEQPSPEPEPVSVAVEPLIEIFRPPESESVVAGDDSATAEKASRKKVRRKTAASKPAGAETATAVRDEVASAEAELEKVDKGPVDTDQVSAAAGKGKVKAASPTAPEPAPVAIEEEPRKKTVTRETPVKHAAKPVEPSATLTKQKASTRARTKSEPRTVPPKPFSQQRVRREPPSSTRVPVATTPKLTTGRTSRTGRSSAPSRRPGPISPKRRRGRSRDRGDRQLTAPTTFREPKPIGKPKEVEVPVNATVGEASDCMGIPASRLITQLMNMGHMYTIVQVVPDEILKDAASKLNYILVLPKPEPEEVIEEDDPESLVPRSPVVTVMGHVDHGKTTLLDAIRNTRVVDREAGGITQHIGAYKVDTSEGEVVFIDTPGHEAFTSMRARGAQVTDLVILVVAADDGVMPQTVEAIHHATAAGVPIVVAINKIDKENAQVDRVKQELVGYDLVPEEWGGKTTMIEISAKQKKGISELIELVLLEAALLELKGNPNTNARGTVIESRLDRGRGPVATLVVQRGTLHCGDAFLCGKTYGKVRAMLDDRGKPLTSAGPSMPVEVLGFQSVPEAGDQLVVMDTEKDAREISALRLAKARETRVAAPSRISFDDLFDRIQLGAVKDLNIIVKGDVQGSVEAVSASLEKLSTDLVKISVIHRGVGNVTEGDVMLASASEAIVVGFGVKLGPKCKEVADREQVEIRHYTIIYDVLDDMKKAIEGMLEPEEVEVTDGKAIVRQIFRLSSGIIAGSFITEGKITRNSLIRIRRGSDVVFEGKLSSLKRFKEDVREVLQGYECGIGIEGFTDAEEEDVIEAYRIEMVSGKADHS